MDAKSSPRRRKTFFTGDDPLGIAYDNFDRDFAERYAGSHPWDRAASIRTAIRTGESFRVESGMDFIEEFSEHPM